MNTCCDTLIAKSPKELYEMYLAKMRLTKQKEQEEKHEENRTENGG